MVAEEAKTRPHIHSWCSFLHCGPAGALFAAPGGDLRRESDANWAGHLIRRTHFHGKQLTLRNLRKEESTVDVRIAWFKRDDGILIMSVCLFH